MAEISAQYTLTTPGVDITFNTAAGTDQYLLTEVPLGLDQAPVRTVVENVPQGDGGLVFDSFKGPRHIVFEGILIPATVSATNRNTMEDNLISALDAILTADGTLSWTPTGGSSRSLTVRVDNGGQVQFSGGKSLSPRAFIFGLVAADPSW